MASVSLNLPEDLNSGWHCNREYDVCQMNNLTGHLASLRGWEMETPMSLVLEPGDRKGGIVSVGAWQRGGRGICCLR